MAKLDELITEIRTAIGADFISTNVVGMDGISIAGGSTDPNYDAEAAVARFAMVMKSVAQTSRKLNLGSLDDNLITTDKMYIITLFLGNGTYFWELAVSREASLGMIRMTISEYAPKLWGAIPF
jgi:predicted regulator of Ras-like GTPase activity (Roadblock/LC7/MglB family)